MDLYTLVFLFFIYSVLGWIAEEVFVLLKQGQLVNRGFLKGPLCPIYGFGMITIIICLSPIKEHLVLLFIGSALLTTALELITGFVLEKIFHTKWWDYSDLHFNFKGYICLSVTVAWGFFSLLLVYVLHPPMERLLLWIPQWLVEPAVLLLTILFVVDATKSIQDALGLKSLMIRLSEHRPSPERLQTLLSYGKSHWRTRSLHRAMSILQRNPSAMSHHHREAFVSLKNLKKIKDYKNRRV